MGLTKRLTDPPPFEVVSQSVSQLPQSLQGPSGPTRTRHARYCARSRGSQSIYVVRTASTSAAARRLEAGTPRPAAVRLARRARRDGVAVDSAIRAAAGLHR